MKFTQKSNPSLQKELADKLHGVMWHGSYFSCFCPVHDNKNTPAFFVYGDGYRCASCGAWGSLDKLDKILAGMHIRYQKDMQQEEIVSPDWKEYREKYGSYKKAYIQAYRTGVDYPILVKYLKQRKVELCCSLGKVGYLDGWLSFPVYDDSGNFVDWVLRSTPSMNTTVKYATRPRTRKNEKFHLYTADWNQIYCANCVYVPFGILDMWTLYKCGYPTATGLTGKSYQVEWFNTIRGRIYLIPDAGEEVDAHRFAQKLGWRARVLEPAWPDGCKDMNDVLRNFGEKKIMEML